MPESSIAIPIRVPTGGERGDIPDHELDINSFRLCQNMMRSNKGRLIIRPGHRRFAATGPGGRIMGLVYYRTATGADRTVAANRTGWWQFASNAWSDISGTALTGGTSDLARFAVSPTSGTYNLIGVNGKDSAKIWDGAAATYSNLGGSPPATPKDVAVANNRTLLLSTPDIIDISDFNNPESWDTTNRRVRVSGGDLLVGMAPIGRLAVAVYGDNSQWMSRAQTGSFPFRFEKIDQKPGPVSPAVIVADGNVHYYLGEDGNVYKSDGISVVAVGNAMQNFVATMMNWTNRAMSHGFLLDDHRVIWWIFPAGVASSPDTGIWLDLRNGSMGRLSFQYAITASGVWRSVVLTTWDDLAQYTWASISAAFATWDAFSQAARRRQMLGDANGQVHLIGHGDGSDNGTPIDVMWDLPLGEWGGSGQAFIPAEFETFFRPAGNTQLALALGTTDTLMSDPSFTDIETIDLTNDQRNAIDLTAVGQADGKRFVTVRHYGSIPRGQLEWLGGKLYGESAGVQPATVGG